MKIRPAHLEHMKQELAKLDPVKVAAHKRALADDPRVKDLDKRLRWDCCYAAGLSTWICDNLYNYMDDTHIDTALKAIVKQLGF